MSLTEDQVNHVLKYINVPIGVRDKGGLAFVTCLVRLHAQRIPFENVSLHYSPHRQISIELDDVFHKIIVQGRGGYCTEVNTLFAALLKGLKFDVRTVMGRVHTGASSSGIGHMCAIVTVDNNRYLVDVGFGAPGAFQPVLLQMGEPSVFQILGSRFGKLEYRKFNEQAHMTQPTWVYSTKETGNGQWKEQYTFSEEEMGPEDYEVINYYTSTNPKSFFTQELIATRIICGEDGLEIPKGSITIFRDELKVKMVGEEDVVSKLRSEQERVEALEKYFWIKLSKKERESIKGLTSAIRVKKREITTSWDMRGVW